MKIKDNLSSLLGSNRAQTASTSQDGVGKVFGVVTDQYSPLFEKAGGWNGVGTVYYLDFEQSTNISQIDLNECKLAKPLFPNNQYYPVIGELVVLVDLPSPSSQITESSSQKYYITVINLWNNIHHNTLTNARVVSFGKTFKEKSNINSISVFEGDHILQSRFGAAIRFGSTSRGKVENPWSKIGEEGDPIIIISNGHNYNSKSTTPYTEDINTDKSGLYLTSTQAIPIKTDKIVLNALTKPIDLSKYSGSQALLVGNRVVLNSKRDDILVFAKKNIEFYTKNIINLNAEDRVHLNGRFNFIGTKPKGELPDEPLLLGDKATDLFDDAFKAIANFANEISSAVATPEGTPLLQINQAAQILSLKMEEIIKKTDSIKSKQNFTA